MEVKRVFDLLDYCVATHNKADALAGKENGAYRKWSTEEFRDNSHFLAYGLIQRGIKRGDRIGIISNNRPEWNFADYSIQLSGAVSVPIYPTISEHDLDYIIKDAGIKAMFISSAELLKRVQAVLERQQKEILLIVFNPIPDTFNWTKLLEEGKANPASEVVDLVKKETKAEDLLTLLYTSGTTGFPKGVMLSHENLISNSFATQDLAPFSPTWRALSFLPLNHVYERMLTTLYIYMGVSIYYAESLETIVDNLKEVRPQIFATVPRLLEKVYDRIVSKGNDLSGIKRKLFFWALDLGLRYELDGKNGWWYEQQLKLANKLIFNKWREALGGEIVVITSGGAALQERLARVFNAAQIKVLEGYGLTETSPVIAVNSFLPGGVCFGTVGKPVKNVQVKIATDGEILVKGPSVMLGYYNKPEATAEVMDADGYFHTGDIGNFVEGGYLKITDRKKEIFKTSGGKYIAPLMIENKLKESSFIEQAMVIGEGRKFASAFLIPAFPALQEWCKKNNIEWTNPADMIRKPEIRKKMMEEVERVNKDLAQYERIKNPALIAQEWTIESGKMTPKLSLKRKVIMSEHQKEYAEIYRDGD